MNPGRLRNLSVLVIGFCTTWSPAASLTLFVAPGGSDANPGTAEQPLATLMGARDAIRSRRNANNSSAEGATVWLRSGHYNLAATAVFGARDSGTAAFPITYSSAPSEQAHLTGAASLDASSFRLVDRESPIWARLDSAARGQVYATELAHHGVRDLGTLKPRGFDLRATSPLELFYNGRPMTLAQWPNAGMPPAWSATAASSTQFIYAGSRPSRWVKAPDVWLHGFWSQDWADFDVLVARICPSAHLVTLVHPPAQYGITNHRPYYAYNLLEELDQPGEYYVDRASGILYFWPPGPLPGSDLQVSLLEASVIALKECRFLVFRDLIIEASRGSLITIVGGDHNRIEGCILRNCGQAAICIDGHHNGIRNCEVTECGEEGVRLAGGDRSALISGVNYVTESHISRTGRSGWTYKPGIAFEGGCGNRATHNLLEDMPHAAILFSGNNHLIAYNEIRNVCRLTSDAGAIYSGRNWGFRGNVIEYNYLHHIVSDLGSPDVNGVYLDDCLSGVKVYANIFYKISGTAIFCGGGRDNIMSNNIIADCGTAHYDDDRGRTEINHVAGSAWNLLETLSVANIAYQELPWSAAYPACAAIPHSWAEVKTGLWRNPQNSVFSHNLGWNNHHWLRESSQSQDSAFGAYASLTGNFPNHRPLFAEESIRHFSWLAQAERDFAPIPIGLIGRTGASSAVSASP